jgi:hypothetical protein
MMEKRLSEITRKEWILYQWLDTGSMGSDEDRVFIKGPRNTPAEAMEAAEEWEFLKEVESEDN